MKVIRYKNNEHGSQLKVVVEFYCETYEHMLEDRIRNLFCKTSLNMLK